MDCRHESLFPPLEPTAHPNELLSNAIKAPRTSCFPLCFPAAAGDAPLDRTAERRQAAGPRGASSREGDDNA